MATFDPGVSKINENKQIIMRIKSRMSSVPHLQQMDSEMSHEIDIT